MEKIAQFAPVGSRWGTEVGRGSDIALADRAGPITYRDYGRGLGSFGRLD
jgi:hypothetical protein